MASEPMEQDAPDVLEAIAEMQERRHAERMLAKETEQTPSTSARVDRLTEYVPIWSNLDLPSQEASIVAEAAHRLRSVPGQAPNNPALAPAKRRAEGTDEYRVPCDAQVYAVYEAFAAVSVVTVLERDGDAERYLTAERTELAVAAALEGRAPTAHPCASLARVHALTVLIPDTSRCPHRALVLNAMALLSHAGQPALRAAKLARMAVLTNEQAHMYAQADNRLLEDHATFLALAYVQEDHGERGVLYAPLAYSDTEHGVLEELIKTTAQLFKDAGLPLPGALAPTQVAGSIENAFVDAHHAINAEFWKRLGRSSPAPRLDYELRFGSGPDEQTFVKLVPRSVVNLDDPEVYFGMLMFREGKYEAKERYVVDAMLEERQNMRGPPQAHIGLRCPRTAQEHEACPHILSMRAGIESFRGELCCFTPGNPGGKMMTPYQSASMPCLMYSLDPYTEHFKRNLWVFPCTQSQIDELHDTHCKAQWQAAMEGFVKYANLTGVPKADGDGAPKESVFHAKKVKGLASIEDEVLSKMVGMPIGSAFRLGDVNALATRTNHAPEVLTAYLSTFIARLGPNASMADALQACVDLERDRAALAAKVDAAKEDSPAPSPPRPPAPVKIEPCTAERFEEVIKDMGLKTKGATKIVGTMHPGNVIAIGRALFTANGKQADPKDANDALIRPHAAACKDMTVVSVAAYLAKEMHDLPIYIAVLLDDGEGMEFYTGSERGNGCLTKVGCEEFVSNTAAALLVKYDVGQKKFYALILAK